MAKDDLTKAQQDLVDHIEAGNKPGLGHNNSPNEGEEQDNPKLFKKEIDYHRYWKDMYENEHKLKQEVEGEMSILKGIETNRVKESEARCGQLQDELDRVKQDNNNLYTRVADSLEVNEHHQNLNGKLQGRIAELEEDNKKISKQIEDQLDRARKAGL